MEFDATAISVLIVGLLIFAILGVVMLAFRRGGRVEDELRTLMSGVSAPITAREASKRRLYGDDGEEIDLESLKSRTGHARVKKPSEDINQKLFKAGYYTVADRARFSRLRIITPCITIPLGLALGVFVMKSPVFVLLGVVIGAFAGYAFPITMLERKARNRAEDTLYFLPLVIEQIAIGVSSSLDIGPCISEIVSMADERDSHNPVTEMFVHTEKLMRSGLSLEEAMVEVSEVNGQSEVKHAFMFLAQCAKHGGEISKQLQELADATMTQRQVYVEGRIAALPVKATGPLATVFAGFFGLLFAGLFVRLISAFGP